MALRDLPAPGLVDDGEAANAVSAANAIMVEHLHVVRWAMKAFGRRYPSMDWDEMHGVCVDALLRASRTYRVGAGKKFFSYAADGLRMALISEHLRRNGPRRRGDYLPIGKGTTRTVASRTDGRRLRERRWDWLVAELRRRNQPGDVELDALAMLLDGRTPVAIARAQGVTAACVRERLKRAQGRMRAYAHTDRAAETLIGDR